MAFTLEHWGALVAGLIIGGFLVGIFLGSKQKGKRLLIEAHLQNEGKRCDELEKKLASREVELNGIRNRTVELQQREAELKTRIDAERRTSKEKELVLEKAQEQLGHTFRALSADALRSNQKQFLQLAESSFKVQQEKVGLELEKKSQAIASAVKPISEDLNKMEGRIGEIERARIGAYASLSEQLKVLNEGHLTLQQETSQLVKALRQPSVRGQWGEMQLRRVIELAGMQEHCDFVTQVTTSDDEGKMLRPDLLVALPGGQQVVVDSKVPMAAFLDALDAKDGEEKELLMLKHAEHVRGHIQQLASKKYQNQFESSPEFVVLFLPSEAFLSAALAQDSSLIEKGVEKGVVVATPTTLIALLRAVASGWRQQALADNAQKISELGRELHSRISVFVDHFGKVGSNLTSLVNHYNKAMGSLDTRVLVSTKKFEQLGVVSESQAIDLPDKLEALVRSGQEAEGIVVSPHNENSETITPDVSEFGKDEDFVGFID